MLGNNTPQMAWIGVVTMLGVFPCIPPKNELSEPLRKKSKYHCQISNKNLSLYII